MIAWKTLKRWLNGGCIYFTLISLLIILANLAMAGEDSLGRINTPAFLLFFPFGLALSAAELLLRNKKIARWIAYLSHYLITVASIYLFLWMPSGTSASPSTPLLIMVLFSVLYWMVFGLVLLIRNRVRKLMEED